MIVVRVLLVRVQNQMRKSYDGRWGKLEVRSHDILKEDD